VDLEVLVARVVHGGLAHVLLLVEAFVRVGRRQQRRPVQQ
jgi:hypothetical protein